MLLHIGVFMRRGGAGALCPTLKNIYKNIESLKFGKFNQQGQRQAGSRLLSARFIQAACWKWNYKFTEPCSLTVGSS